MIYDAHTTLESELHYYPLGLPKRMCRSLGRMLDRRLPRRASHVIAVSEEISKTLLELAELSEDEIDVIPNGVEATAVRRGRAGPTQGRRRAGS